MVESDVGHGANVIRYLKMDKHKSSNTIIDFILDLVQGFNRFSCIVLTNCE
jgi:hypothetical protein